MDNQGMKVIKAYLTPQQVDLQLFKLHNHYFNAADHVIQTFKNQFIGALGTTNTNAPLKLQDKLAPQVQGAINLLQCLQICPNISAYKTLKDPYDWNHYPMAHPGTKAIIYKDSNRHTLLVPHSLLMLGS
jgi:hypothetical protein